MPNYAHFVQSKRKRDMYQQQYTILCVAFDTKNVWPTIANGVENSSIYIGRETMWTKYIIVYDAYVKSVSLASFIHQAEIKLIVRSHRWTIRL